MNEGSRHDEALLRLAERAGILLGYHDIWGTYHRTTPATALALVQGMGLGATAHDATAALEALEDEAFVRALPRVVVCVQQATPYTLHLSVPTHAAGQEHRWALTLETGEKRTAPVTPAALELDAERTAGNVSYRRYRFRWYAPLPLGQHRFALLGPDGAERGSTTLFVTPSQCHEPLHEGERGWGLAVQLYAVRSRSNWGIGDFGDLGIVVERAAALGADAVGLNPLHALFPDQPDRSSPYSPSSRLFFNPLYLAIEALPEFAECKPVQRRVGSETFQTRLAVLRRADLVNYAGVARVKIETLAALYAHFRTAHLAKNTDHARAFASYVEARGEPLERYALFHALQDMLCAQSIGIYGWRQWPDEYRDPDSEAVQRYARAARDDIDFHRWLQWHCERQLGDVAARARASGMRIGLYLDLAVSVSPDGADAWSGRHVFGQGVGVGAPPDDFNPKGQDWGLPPYVPASLRETAYAPFLATLDANMRHAGALRVDHVMALMRLFWVPGGATAVEGAYVQYPFQDLAHLLALESVRRKTLVIGEDLGTVPDEVRATLGALRVLSYRLLVFERDERGAFRPPGAYPANALVAATTHDLPTLAGWWAGSDIALREKLKLFPTEKLRAQQIAARPRERSALLAALAEQKLLPASVPEDATKVRAMTPALAEAVQVFLARSPARLQMVQLEDVFGELEQTNLPGTTHEHANWCRKLTVPLEDWHSHEGLARLARRIAAEGRGRGPAAS